MSLTPQKIKELFAPLQEGRSQDFFARVADDVSWTIVNPNKEFASFPFAGQYNSKKDVLWGAFSKIGAELEGQLALQLQHEPIVADDSAFVELKATKPDGSVPVSKNGTKFDNRYAWYIRVEGDKIVEVRAYLDSAMVNELFA